METNRTRRTRNEAHDEKLCLTNGVQIERKDFNINPTIGYVLNDIMQTLGLVNQIPKKTYIDRLPAIYRLIYSGGKTIIIWDDGDKTIVSCGEGEEFDHYAGFCAAIVKKVFGSTTAAKKVMNKFLKEVENHEKI